MKNFLIVYSENARDAMLKNGFKLHVKQEMSEGYRWVFINKSGRVNFAELDISNVEVTNKLRF